MQQVRVIKKVCGDSGGSILRTEDRWEGEITNQDVEGKW